MVNEYRFLYTVFGSLARRKQGSKITVSFYTVNGLPGEWYQDAPEVDRPVHRKERKKDIRIS